MPSESPRDMLARVERLAKFWAHAGLTAEDNDALRYVLESRAELLAACQSGMAAARLDSWNKPSMGSSRQHAFKAMSEAIARAESEAGELNQAGQSKDC